MSAGEVLDSSLSSTKYAPFTVEEIWSINQYQRCGQMHPLTCKCGHLLMAIPEGLYCPKCKTTQTWIYRWIANGNWRKL